MHQQTCRSLIKQSILESISLENIMETWQLLFLGPFAAAFLVWLISPVLLITIPAILIIAYKKYANKEDIGFYKIIKAFVLTVLFQLIIFTVMDYCLPLFWQPNPNYLTTGASFFTSQVLGFVLMVYLLSHYDATKSAN